VFQKECIHRLQNRIEVQYGSANKEHRVLRFLLTLNCPYEVHLVFLVKFYVLLQSGCVLFSKNFLIKISSTK